MSKTKTKANDNDNPLPTNHLHSLQALTTTAFDADISVDEAAHLTAALAAIDQSIHGPSDLLCEIVLAGQEKSLQIQDAHAALSETIQAELDQLNRYKLYLDFIKQAEDICKKKLEGMYLAAIDHTRKKLAGFTSEQQAEMISDKYKEICEVIDHTTLSDEDKSSRIDSLTADLAIIENMEAALPDNLELTVPKVARALITLKDGVTLRYSKDIEIINIDMLDTEYLLPRTPDMKAIKAAAKEADYDMAILDEVLGRGSYRIVDKPGVAISRKGKK